MDIDALNAEFGLDGTLRFAAGRGGLTMIEVYNDVANALISPYAGQVLSYCPAGTTDDLLFVSERAYFAPGKAIKGGIPICWPWFGADPEGRGRPAHGFVRAWPWSVLATSTLPSGATRITLGVTDDTDTRALWPYYFNLLVEVTVGASLECRADHPQRRGSDLQCHPGAAHLLPGGRGHSGRGPGA